MHLPTPAGSSTTKLLLLWRLKKDREELLELSDNIRQGGLGPSFQSMLEQAFRLERQTSEKRHKNLLVSDFFCDPFKAKGCRVRLAYCGQLYFGSSSTVVADSLHILVRGVIRKYNLTYTNKQLYYITGQRRYKTGISFISGKFLDEIIGHLLNWIRFESSRSWHFRETADLTAFHRRIGGIGNPI